jgi:hypothetical protein
LVFGLWSLVFGLWSLSLSWSWSWSWSWSLVLVLVLVFVFSPVKPKTAIKTSCVLCLYLGGSAWSLCLPLHLPSPSPSPSPSPYGHFHCLFLLLLSLSFVFVFCYFILFLLSLYPCILALSWARIDWDTVHNGLKYFIFCELKVPLCEPFSSFSSSSSSYLCELLKDNTASSLYA